MQIILKVIQNQRGNVDCRYIPFIRRKQSHLELRQMTQIGEHNAI